MRLEDKIIHMQVTMSSYLLKRWKITPEKFVELDKKYKILWYIRLCVRAGKSAELISPSEQK